MAIVDRSWKFTEWFAQQFNKQLTLSKRVEKIEMKFHVTKIKTIYTKWVTQFYNHMSTEYSSKVNINGWRRFGIFKTTTNDSPALPSIDKFQDITPLSSTNDGGNEIV